MNRKILLLGATGQLGSLVKTIAPEEVTLISPSSNELDICSRAAVKQVLSNIKPDVIINCAAYTEVDKAEQESDYAFALNSKGPLYLAEAAPEKTKIIQISTDFVFSGKNNIPYQADDLTEPLNVYGKSKLAGEKALLDIMPTRATIIRTAWLYSAIGNNFVNTMLKLMNSRESLTIVSDQQGTPSSAYRLAEVIWRFVANKETSGIYHWTDQGHASWYEFACEIQAIALDIGLLKKAIKLKPVSTMKYPTLAQRPAYSVLNKSKTYQALNYSGDSWQQELRLVLKKIIGFNE